MAGLFRSSMVEDVFGIIARELRISVDDLEEDVEFADLGLDRRLAESILSQISQTLQIYLVPTDLETHTTPESLRSFLIESFHNCRTNSVQGTLDRAPTETKPLKQPLSFLLQGSLNTSKQTVFLLPDGSGSGMAYARLSQIHPDVCVVALNSPFLHCLPNEKFTVEGIAAIWTEEIVRRKPHGSYVLGGWSAGGYYATEVAKNLIRQGMTVEKIILIDSPCRLVYEELPMEVVHYLAENRLMGTWGTKGTPKWMIDHFDKSIEAISIYQPTPISSPAMPEICVIWARDGVLTGPAAVKAELDMNVRVTQFLVLRNHGYGPLGWDQLFPGAKLSIVCAEGNHFTMVHPPHCTSLSAVLRSCFSESAR